MLLLQLQHPWRGWSSLSQGLPQHSSVRDGDGADKWACNRLGSSCKTQSAKFSREAAALPYSQQSLFLLTVCWKDFHCVVLSTSGNLLQADAFCFLSQPHRGKMGKDNPCQISAPRCIQMWSNTGKLWRRRALLVLVWSWVTLTPTDFSL